MKFLMLIVKAFLGVFKVFFPVIGELINISVEFFMNLFNKDGGDFARRTALKNSEIYYKQFINEGRSRSFKINNDILSGFLAPKPFSETDKKAIKKISKRKKADEPKNAESDERELFDFILKKWREDKKHIMLVGEGGMGKTVSLVYIWNIFLHGRDNKQKKAKIVPIFIQLNEYNISGGSNFIAKKICDAYYPEITFNDAFADKIFQSLSGIRNEESKNALPTTVLLLDGFNEISREDRTPLIYELCKIIDRFRGIQIVITSRYDIRTSRGWNDSFSLYVLAPLASSQIEGYLKEKQVAVPTDRELLKLISNPMMLILYADVAKKITEKEEYKLIEYKENIVTSGELIYNYIEAQVLNILRGPDEARALKNTFLIKQVLPYIGYRMEIKGDYSLRHTEMVAVIRESISEFQKERYSNFLSGLYGSNYLSRLGLNSTDINYAAIIEILTDELHMLSAVRSSYSFNHQNYRDFFSSIHIIFDMEIAIDNGKDDYATTLEARMLPVHIMRFIGEIEGEQYIKKQLEAFDYTYSENESKFSRYLEKFRYKFDREYEPAVKNLIEIWKTSRKELSGIDLSDLNLFGCVFNSVICGKKSAGDEMMSAVFSGSALKFTSFMPQGHFQWIYDVSYCNDYEGCISASRDGFVKEWNLKTRECVFTYNVGSEVIFARQYGKTKIVFISAAGFISLIDKEASVNEVLQYNLGAKPVTCKLNERTKTVFVILSDKSLVKVALSGEETGTETISKPETLCHFNETPYCLDINRAGTRAILGYNDGSISEIELSNGILRRVGNPNLPVASLSGASAANNSDNAKSASAVTPVSCGVSALAYKTGADIIAFALKNGMVYEWNMKQDTVSAVYSGHTEGVRSLCYNRDFTRILTASDDDTVKEWSVENQICVQTYVKHYDSVLCAVYGQHDDKILSSSRDFSICEWDVKTGESILTLPGFSYFSRSTRFNYDTTKILAPLCDGVIREFDAENGSCLSSYLGHKGRIYCALYSPDNSKILSASLDGFVFEWDVENELEYTVCCRHDTCVDRAEYKDDDTVFSVSSDGTVKKSVRRDGNNWETVFSFNCLSHAQTDLTPTVGTNKVSFSNEPDILYTSHWDGIIRKWHISENSAECILEFKGHTDWVYACVFDETFDCMYTSSRDGMIIKWDVKTGEILESVNLKSGSVYTLMLNASGQLLCSTSGRAVLIVDFSDKPKVVGHFQGHESRVFSAAYNDDFSKVVSFSEDGTIRVWDAESYKCLLVIPNIMGIIVSGCDFTNPKKPLNDEEKRILRLYGGIC